MPKLEDLNDAQREAATHIDGPCVVVAGAGSGKTSMLVTRVEQLMKARVPPNRILCCTFTRKAMKEMGERMVREIGPRAKPVVVSTIHGLALRMVLPRMDGWKLVSKTQWMFEVVLGPKSHVNRFGTGLSKDLSVDDAILAVSKAKNSKQKPSQVGDAMIRQVYLAYEALKNARKMLDFDDLLIRANQFLQTDPDFAAQMQSRFTHIMVDEFQDVNLVQWDLLQKLAEQHRNLFVVGDDMQSIYGFRGSKPELILQFARYYPDAKTILLERNYRSREPIIVASNRIMKLNHRQMQKRIVAQRTGGEPLRTLNATDEFDEALQVVHTIQSLRTAFPELKWSDFAVLYRTNQESIPFESMFLENKIPYELSDGTHFFESFRVKPILAYMRLLDMLNHDEFPEMDDLMAALKNPQGVLSRSALERIQVEGPDVLFHHPDYEDYLNALLQVMDEDRPTEFVDKLGEVFPALAETEPGEMWLDALKRAYSKFPTLKSFLEHVDYVLKQAREPKEDAVRCMSVHQSKGLEFGTVFVANLVEGCMPYQRAVDEGNLEEETRLFYVAMTRAMDRLYVCIPKTLGTKPVAVSRYAEELKGDLFH